MIAFRIYAVGNRFGNVIYRHKVKFAVFKHNVKRVRTGRNSDPIGKLHTEHTGKSQHRFYILVEGYRNFNLERLSRVGYVSIISNRYLRIHAENEFLRIGILIQLNFYVCSKSYVGFISAEIRRKLELFVSYGKFDFGKSFFSLNLSYYKARSVHGGINGSAYKTTFFLAQDARHLQHLTNDFGIFFGQRYR